MEWLSFRKLKIFVFMAFLTLFLCLFESGFKVEAATDIRVGLKSTYFDKKIITIYNTEIKMGYCINDSYRSDIVLKSVGGFSFEPDKSE